LSFTAQAQLTVNKAITTAGPYKVGDTISLAELLEIIIIPVNKETPLADNTTITRVNLIDLGRVEGFKAIHYGGEKGMMHKDRGNNELPATAKIVNIFKPINGLTECWC
jgi:hypothetical protein